MLKKFTNKKNTDLSRKKRNNDSQLGSFIDFPTLTMFPIRKGDNFSEEEQKDSVVFWKDKKTGFSSHGNLMSSNSASQTARMVNDICPEVKHVVVNLTHDQLKKIEESKVDKDEILNQFTPFRS